MPATITAPGRLVKEPRLTDTSTGKKVLNLRVAVDRYDSQTRTKVSDFFEVSVWGAQAERLAGMLTVGSFVVVAGEFAVREYEHNGLKRQELRITADRVDLGPRSASAGDDRRAATASPTQTPGASAAAGVGGRPEMDDEIPF